MNQLTNFLRRKPDRDKDKDTVSVQWQPDQPGSRDSQLTLNIERLEADETQSASKHRGDVTDAIVAEPAQRCLTQPAVNNSNNQPSPSSSITSADRVHQHPGEAEIVAEEAVVSGTEPVTTATTEVIAQQEADIKHVALSSSPKTGASPTSSSRTGISPGCCLLLLLVISSSLLFVECSLIEINANLR